MFGSVYPVVVPGIFVAGGAASSYADHGHSLRSLDSVTDGASIAPPRRRCSSTPQLIFRVLRCMQKIAIPYGMTIFWYTGRDSNPQPSEPESDALSIEPPVHSSLIITSFPGFVKGAFLKFPRSFSESLGKNVVFPKSVCYNPKNEIFLTDKEAFSMAGIQHFRTAIGGFNRQDVVSYIEYLNNQHNSQIEQLNTQLQAAQEAAQQSAPNTELQSQLDAALARCAELEAQLTENGQAPICSGDELEAYRRAERAERLARDRAAQIYAQANAALADVTVKVESISDGMNTLTEQFNAQLQNGKQQLQEAVASLYAIRPEEE